MPKIETSPFKRLLGIWKTSGQVLSENNRLPLLGTDSYELILDGNYMLHKVDVMMGDERNETYEMINLKKSSDTASMQFFDSKGESGTMTGQINGNDFQIHGDGIKFVGTINDDNTEVRGKWFLQAEDKSWNEYIELKLDK